jgi:hypothetical protein
MAHVTIIHINDVHIFTADPSARNEPNTSSHRYALLLHLPPFDLSPVATVSIIIDGSVAASSLPPFNNGAPWIIKASGFRAGETRDDYLRCIHWFSYHRLQALLTPPLCDGPSAMAVAGASQGRGGSSYRGLRRKCW